jgi:hypothetical protein
VSGAFDPEAFDPEAFDTGSATPPPPPSGGGHRGPGPLRVSFDLTPEDEEEWALFAALARHRLRL